MKLYQVVLKDIRRRKRRVLYAVLGVVIGTMTVVSILTVAAAGQARITAQLEKYGANLSVMPATKTIDNGLGDLSLGTMNLGDNYISEDKVPQIRQIADHMIKEALGITEPGNIASIAPKLFVNADIKGAQVVAVGIDPEEQFKVNTWWQVAKGEYLDTGDQALLGSQAAAMLKLDVGDAVSLNGRTLTVVGILHDTGAGDDYQAFVPLATLQGAYNKHGLISSVDIRALCNACPVEIIADGINQNISGVRAVAVKQIADSEMGMLQKIGKFMLALAGVSLVVGGFGVFNTLLTSINERIRDLAIMRAVGASGGQITKALIYEAIVVGVAGGVLGYGAGTLLAYAIGPLIFEGTSILFVAPYLPLSIGLAILISLLATLYPAMRATRVKIADCFRAV
ncbi:MAG: ABC transporter permease [Chloroflexi bacterium]|nr:ABC transporter permease [Chloroflexota bacterium]